MIKLISPTIIILLIVSALSNCATKPKRSRKPVTSISISPKSKSYVTGTELSMSATTKLRNGEIDNIKVYLDSKLILESKDLVNQVEIKTNNLTMGHHSINVVATKKDGVKGNNYIRFELKSDIVPKNYTVKIKNTYPHNPKFFTQGFQIHNGYFYEGTGDRGKSAIYKTDIKSGRVLQDYKMEDKYWGEGITIMEDKIYQLTYHAQTGFIYDLKTLKPVDSWNYKPKEGWGLTNDGKHLIMSEGSEVISFLDPKTLNPVRKIEVYNNRGAVKKLNELEYIKGEIWANIFTTFIIVRIDPASGKVLGEIDLKGINVMLDQGKERIDVLNGIAWDKKKDKIYVTGKLWPKIFEIELVEN